MHSKTMRTKAKVKIAHTAAFELCEEGTCGDPKVSGDKKKVFASKATPAKRAVVTASFFVAQKRPQTMTRGSWPPWTRIVKREMSRTSTSTNASACDRSSKQLIPKEVSTTPRGSSCAKIRVFAAWNALPERLIQWRAPASARTRSASARFSA